jgi:signal peptidase I
MKLLSELYAIALYAYPREFRQRFGREMQQVFETRCQRDPHLIPSTFVDLLVSAIQERLAIMTLPRLARGFAYAITGMAVFLAASLTVVQAFVIPTASMEPSLRTGDHVIVNKLPHSPQRDELVVFHYPVDPKQTFIKRVIGLPGDRIHLSNKQVFRNGQPLTEPYAEHKTDYLDDYRDNFPKEPQVSIPEPGQAMLAKNIERGEIVVPPGAVFVMGDNRDNSLDSRYFGFVPQSNFVGRPWFVYWSYDEQAGSTRWDRTPLAVR